MRTKAARSAILLLCLFVPAAAQKLTGSLRGYPVHQERVRVVAGSVRDASVAEKADVVIDLGEPKLVSAGLFGVTIEIGCDVLPIGYSGHVDFLTFEDLRINGVTADADEYAHSFDFTRGKSLSLPTPLRVSVGGRSLAKAAYAEIFAARSEWPVTGTIFVYGRFKKFGFSFKRVVPVKIELRIKNPLNK